MPADLRLVPHAAKRHANELSTNRSCDRLTKRRLSDSRRTDEAEDRARDLVGQGANREVLEDALLDLFEAVVVLVEIRAASLMSRLSVVATFRPAG